MITLSPCPPDQLSRLAGLRQHPGQYAGDGADMISDPTPGISFHEIRRDGVLVGCFKLDPLYFQRHSFADPDMIGVRGVLIDRAHQGGGIGKSAMALLGPYIAEQFPTARAAILTVNLINPSARRVYLAAGFSDMGAIYYGGTRGPQHILTLTLR